MNPSNTMRTTFIEEFFIYVGRMRLFNKTDWLVYFAWIGMMLGLLFSVSFFFFAGVANGVKFPPVAWNVPAGIVIFVIAIGIDTIGHRTIYKAELQKAEALVHHITIFAGVTSIVLLCLAYHYRDALRIPAITFVGLAVFYSMIDEWMHWKRYLAKVSDRVEMWSHFFIFVGHIIMSLAWYAWFETGYGGVAETLAALGAG